MNNFAMNSKLQVNSYDGKIKKTKFFGKLLL